jgi:protein O-mannosyl-transferase
MAWVYFPGLSGSFTFDDYHNIYKNEHIKIDHFSIGGLWQAALSSDSGPLKRPIAMLSFAINHVLTGMDPWWMKFTNLLIHLVNGLLVLLIMKQLINRFYGSNRSDITFIPFIIMGIWLIHPIHVTAVSYIVQRMTSLSATFVLFAIVCYLKLREGKVLGWKTYAVSLSMMLCWLLGLLTKETALLLSIYIFVLEWCVYGFKTDTKKEKILLRIIWGLFAAPWLCAVCYVIYDPSFVLNGYGGRHFTLTERVFTEFRIVCEYIRLIILPDVRVMGLFHDDIVVSTSILSPIATLTSMIFIAGLLILAIKLRKTHALFSLGLLWFLGGHLLESTVFPLELMFLHRNYLPSIGLLLMVTIVGMRLAQNHRKLFAVAAVLVMLSFSIGTRSLSHQWSSDWKMLLIEVMNNPNSVRANFKAGQVYKFYAITNPPGEQRDKYKSKAIEYFENLQKLEPLDITGDLAILETNLQLQEMPSELLIEKIVQKLPNANISRAVINIFESYKRCFLKDECTLTPNDFEKMLAALFSNKYIGNDVKRIILILKAEYLVESQNNIDVAITTVLEAIILNSELEDYMLLAQYYRKGGYHQEMYHTIKYLEEHDDLGRFRKPINDLKRN